MDRIIYKDDQRRVVVITPTQEALISYGIHAIAKKDVPFGKAFAIIDSSTIPSIEDRDSWVVEDKDLKGGVGVEINTFDSFCHQ